MIEVFEPVPLELPPGKRRRDLMRQLQIRIGVSDFSEEEWAEIDAEAPGTRAFIEAQFSC